MTVLEQDFEYIASSSMVNYDVFRSKSFLISGATGLIGSLCVRALLYINRKYDLNLNVFAIVRDIHKADLIYEGEKPNYIKMDLVQDEIPLSMPNIDYIIHAAAVTNSKTMVSYPVDTILTSLYGTEKILKFAITQEVLSVIYISSMEVYGTVDKDGLIMEDELGFIPLDDVRSCYPESKRMCENLCVSYASQFGLNVCNARLAQTFGAGILPMENRVFAQFARSVIRGEDIVLHTTGESEGNYVYSADAVLALLFLLQNGKKGEAYNVNNQDSHYKIKNMAAMVADEISGNIKVVYDIPDNEKKFGYAPAVKLHLCSEKINKLGWRAKIDMKESYDRLITYMKESNWDL